MNPHQNKEPLSNWFHLVRRPPTEIWDSSSNSLPNAHNLTKLIVVNVVLTRLPGDSYLLHLRGF